MTKTKTVHVAIIGSALSGNKGAAAMLESSIQTLTKQYGKNVTFTLLSMYPSEDSKQNPYPNLEIIDASPLKLGVTINSQALAYKLFPFFRKMIVRKSPAIRALKKADVLLDQGGITFVDGREKFLIYNVASILPALFVGTPVVKCAQALGPFKSSVNRATAKMFLPKMGAIVSRGSITHKYLSGLKLSNVVAGADYAFSLELTDSEKKRAAKQFELPKTKRPIVGVCPSVVMQKKIEARGGDYVGIMAEFINYLDDKGYAVALIPHSVRTGVAKTHNNDLPLCTNIYNQLNNKDNCLFLDRELTSQELRYWIGCCDLFVASRFHAMVSSLAMQVPTLVVGWSHKYREVLEMFELENRAFDSSKFSLKYLKSQFEDLVANQKEIKAKLVKNLPKVKEKSRLQVQVIADVIDKKRGRD